MRNKEKERHNSYLIFIMKNISLLIAAILMFCNILLLSSCSSRISTPTPDNSKQSIPPSMKGYEIYSWEEEGQWVFKLMTGTNRQKSIEEIMSNSETIQDDAWVNIKINGVDDLKTILEKLTKGDSLFWLSTKHIVYTADQANPIVFPPDAMIDDILELCKQIGVDLVISE